MLQSLSINLDPQGIATWFVSVDEREARSQAKQLLDEHAITSPTYLVSGPLDAFKLAVNPRWPGMIPATFLFDGTGKLRYFWGGPVYESDILPVVEGFLAGQAIDGEADFTIAPGQITH